MIQNSFLALAQQKQLRCERFLNEMEKIIPWDKFSDEIQPFYEEKETGRKRMELIIMLKTVWVFSIPAVGRSAGGLNVSHIPWFGAYNPKKWQG